MKKLAVLGLVLVAAAGVLVLGKPSHTDAAGMNLVANPSVEVAASASQPKGWTSGKWGTNTAAFSYPNTGRTGTRSVRIDMTAHTDGDAKWLFNPVSVIPNKTYTFSDYYQSNAQTEIVVQYTHENGAISYAWLGSSAPSATGKAAVYHFTMPSTARKATVMHLIS